MRYLRLTCPGCNVATAFAIDENEHAVKCPNCGQRNTNLPESAMLTGMCGECKQPIDDHIFVGQFYGDCPKIRKEWK